jgi:nucleotide-binding universal stress UspA family protein
MPSIEPAETYSRILVTLDGSELAEEVLPHVEALAAKLNAAVTLLRAVSPPDPPFAGPVFSPHEAMSSPQVMSMIAADPTIANKQRVQEALGYLANIEARLSKQGLHVELECPEAQWPAAAIVECAQQIGADLIAMTTHGRTGLGRTVLGSVADEVIRKAECPVMVVRGGAKD